MFVILVLVLQLTEITGKFSPRFVVRDGDDVTLPCDNMRDEQDRCEKTNWLFSNSPDSSVTVSTDRQVSEKTDRLEVAADCSLVIRNVSHEDVGFYTCRTSHISLNHDAHAHLFLITMTEKEDGDQLLPASCFVATNEMCKHTVEWMYEGKPVEDTMIMKTSRCSVTVVIPESFLKNKPDYPEMFSCKVKDDSTETDQLFPLSPQAAGSDVSITNAGGEANETEPAFKNTSTTPLNLWLYVVVSIGSVALIITILVISLCKRREEERSLILQDVEQSLNSASVLSNPGNGPNTVDPEDELPYATICRTENAKRKTWDDEKPGDSVTYSSVKVDSPDSLNANQQKIT